MLPQVRMPSKSDKIGSARSPDDVARKSVSRLSLDLHYPLCVYHVQCTVLLLSVQYSVQYRGKI